MPFISLSYSPAQLLQSREIRTLINNFNNNIFVSKVHVKVNYYIDVMTKIKERQVKIYNKTVGKIEREFVPGNKECY